MASSDWALFSDVLSTSSVARNPVTSAVVAMTNGGGDFAFGMHSRDNSPGVVAYYSVQSSFSPAAKGGIISGCIQKGAGAGNDDFSCWLFICCGGTATTNVAYMLGLDDSATPRLVLRKGQLASGIVAAAPGANGVLRRSSATYDIGAWLHVRLDAIKQPGGDVLLQVYASDLADNSAASPVWESVPGMTEFTDDAGGINSSALNIAGADALPLTSGRMGFGARFADVNRNAYFDYIKPERQTLP